jgi:hypothetical protein
MQGWLHVDSNSKETYEKGWKQHMQIKMGLQFYIQSV